MSHSRAGHAASAGSSRASASLAFGVVALVLLAQACPRDPARAGVMLATCAVVFAAALLGSLAGFAFSALAGAGLVYLDRQPVHLVQLLLCCSLTMQVLLVGSVWRAIAWRRLAPFLAGGIVTVPAGVHWIRSVSTPAYAGALGALLLAYGTFRLCARSPRRLAARRWHAVATGALGGITAGIAAFPSAFVTICCGLRGWDKVEQRAVVQPYILAMQALALLAMRHDGLALPLGRAELACIAAALSATLLGTRLLDRLSSPQFAVVVNATLLVSGALLLARAW